MVRHLPEAADLDQPPPTHEREGLGGSGDVPRGCLAPGEKVVIEVASLITQNRPANFADNFVPEESFGAMEQVQGVNFSGSQARERPANLLARSAAAGRTGHP